MLSAITKHYSFSQLRQDLGIGEERKPYGYYKEETIFQEAATFCQNHGDISFRLLSKESRSSLWQAIKNKYPGGLPKLKIDLLLSGALAQADLDYQMQDILEELKGESL